MSELLPCPFCGSDRVEGQVDDGLHWVRCRSCQATGPVTTKYAGEEGEKFSDWNTRTQPTEQAQPVAWEYRYRLTLEGAPWKDWGKCDKEHFELIKNYKSDSSQYEWRELYTAPMPAAAEAAPDLTWKDIRDLAEAAATPADIVDHDCVGKPITHYDVMITGAYSPFVLRLVNLAVQKYSGIDTAQADGMRGDDEAEFKRICTLLDEKCKAGGFKIGVSVAHENNPTKLELARELLEMFEAIERGQYKQFKFNDSKLVSPPAACPDCWAIEGGPHGCGKPGYATAAKVE